MKIHDSDVIINFLKNDKKAAEKIRSATEEREELATTVFNEQEVLYGALKGKSRSRFSMAKEFFSSLNILDYEHVEHPA